MFSRGIFGIQTWYSIFGFNVEATLLDPPAIVTRSPRLASYRNDGQRARVWIHPDPAELKSVAPSHWELVRETMHEDLRKRVRAVAQALVAPATTATGATQNVAD